MGGGGGGGVGGGGGRRWLGHGGGGGGSREVGGAGGSVDGGRRPPSAPRRVARRRAAAGRRRRGGADGRGRACGGGGVAVPGRARGGGGGGGRGARSAPEMARGGGGGGGGRGRACTRAGGGAPAAGARPSGRWWGLLLDALGRERTRPRWGRVPTGGRSAADATVGARGGVRADQSDSFNDDEHAASSRNRRRCRAPRGGLVEGGRAVDRSTLHERRVEAPSVGDVARRRREVDRCRDSARGSVSRARARGTRRGSVAAATSMAARRRRDLHGRRRRLSVHRRRSGCVVSVAAGSPAASCSARLMSKASTAGREHLRLREHRDRVTELVECSLTATRCATTFTPSSSRRASGSTCPRRSAARPAARLGIAALIDRATHRAARLSVHQGRSGRRINRVTRQQAARPRQQAGLAARLQRREDAGAARRRRGRAGEPVDRRLGRGARAVAVCSRRRNWRRPRRRRRRSSRRLPSM